MGSFTKNSKKCSIALLMMSGIVHRIEKSWNNATHSAVYNKASKNLVQSKMIALNTQFEFFAYLQNIDTLIVKLPISSWYDNTA